MRLDVTNGMERTEGRMGERNKLGLRKSLIEEGRDTVFLLQKVCDGSERGSSELCESDIREG